MVADKVPHPTLKMHAYTVINAEELGHVEDKRGSPCWRVKKPAYSEAATHLGVSARP